MYTKITSCACTLLENSSVVVYVELTILHSPTTSCFVRPCRLFSIPAAAEEKCTIPRPFSYLLSITLIKSGLDVSFETQLRT